MAVGWAGDGAVSDQINDSISDAVARARRELPRGESLKFCEDCGEEIPAARRAALPGVRLCLECQAAAEKNRSADYSLYNRRGSKDSQLR
ncbi:MAG: DksA/TraR family C4-type zinc finger protein [Candidatus Adiutrix sp.]|jgi:phage/conjugal plasmid C-4 type zinc finger TraR family protein|nr:DksA/TraR family C4-type zinc finger protein [Candidatus Adiutrix sp.]